MKERKQLVDVFRASLQLLKVIIKWNKIFVCKDQCQSHQMKKFKMRERL